MIFCRLKLTKSRCFLKKGTGLIEVVAGVAIVTVCLAGLIAAYGMFARAGLAVTDGVKANYLMEEGMEAVTSTRDSGWGANIAALAASTTYRLAWVNGKWLATTSDSLIDGKFERNFILNNVYRDGNGNIAVGGTADSGTKKITVYVSWPDKNGTTTKSLATYLTNLFNN